MRIGLHFKWNLNKKNNPPKKWMETTIPSIMQTVWMGVAWKLIRQEVTANLPKSLTHWHGSWGVLSLGGTDIQGFFFLPWLHGNLPDWQQQDVPSWSASSSVLHSEICGFIIIFFCFWGFFFFFFLVRRRQLLNEIWWNLYKLISLISWKC